MKKNKIQKPFTFGYLPYNLPTQTYNNLTAHTGLKYRILIFYKVIFNAYHRKPNSIIDYHEYVSIPSQLAEKILGEKRAKEAIKFLINNGLLEMIPHYYSVDGGKPSYTRRFRIPYHLLGIGLFKTRLYRKVAIYDKKAARAELNYKQEKVKLIAKITKDEVLIKLIDGLKDLYLDLGSPDAKKIVAYNGFNIAKNNLTYYRFMYEINYRNIEWHRRDDYGRIHNVWVSLNKKCHSLLRFKNYENEQLAEIDIVNSQPFISSIVNPNTIIQLLPEALNLVEGINFETQDWHEYRNICVSGTFYERWQEQLCNYFGANWQSKVSTLQQLALAKKKKKKKLKLDYSKASPRQVAKSLFYVTIFGTQHATCIVSQCFKSWLPDVYNAFKTIKSRYAICNPSRKNKKNGKGSYTNLMWIMQRIEAELVLQNCAKTLLNSGVTQIVTRHDSLMAPVSLIDIVEQELVNSFNIHGLPVPKLDKKIPQ